MYICTHIFDILDRNDLNTWLSILTSFIICCLYLFVVWNKNKCVLRHFIRNTYEFLFRDELSRLETPLPYLERFYQDAEILRTVHSILPRLVPASLSFPNASLNGDWHDIRERKIRLIGGWEKQSSARRELSFAPIVSNVNGILVKTYQCLSPVRCSHISRESEQWKFTRGTCTQLL